MNKPNRRFEFELQISGDTWDDVMRNFEEMYYHVQDHGTRCYSVGGGPSSGHWIQITEDPNMDHDKYFAALDRYLEAQAEGVDAKKPQASTL